MQNSALPADCEKWRRQKRLEVVEIMLSFSCKLSPHGTKDIMTYGSEANMFGESKKCTPNMVIRFEMEFSRSSIILIEAPSPRPGHQNQPS